MQSALLNNEVLISKIIQSTVVSYSHNQTFSMSHRIIMYSIQDQNIRSLEYIFLTGEIKNNPKTCNAK